MPRDIKQIFKYQQNVAEILDDTELEKISQDAIRGYKGDDESLSDWKKRNKEGMVLAAQLADEEKTFPFEGAANIMYPLISISAIQFASRAYPNLIPGWDIVKGKVIGRDQDGAKADRSTRVSTHMNYQLNEEMTEWEEETDRLLTIVPVLGSCFKETYFSPNMGRNVSMYYSPYDIVMNYKAKSMDTVPRITKKYVLYKNEIVERIRSGLFIDYEIGTAQKTKDDDDQYEYDAYKPHLFYQQQTFLDLDNDGYSEPYMVFIDGDREKIVSIVPRFGLGDIHFNDRNQIKKIDAHNYYTKFSFLNSFDGSIYDLGFGSLLGPINHTVNTTIDQLLDAGTINNCQGGFIGRNISLGRGQSGGPLEIGINEWVPVNHAGDDLRKNIVPLKEFMKEPSTVLFSLLGFMVQAGEKLSSVTELLMGEQTVQNEPATTSLARIEQGLKVFGSIHKRLHKSFSKEFRQLYDLNAKYLNPKQYYRILDAPEITQEVGQDDYDKDSCDIVPVSNPEDVSSTQKMVKSQMLMGLKGTGFNDMEINKRFIESMNVPDPQSILEAPPPPPDPDIVIKQEELSIKRDELEFEMMKYPDEKAKTISETIKNLALAEAAEVGPQMEFYKAQLNAIIEEGKIKQAGQKTNENNRAGL